MAQTLAADPIISLAEAQTIFDYRDENEAIYHINALSAKARAWLNRVQLNYNGTTAVTENLRTAETPTLYLHASPITFDGTHDVTVEYYARGVLDTTWTASDIDLVVSSSPYSARIDTVSSWFPWAQEDCYLAVSYYGGWSAVPGDVFAGAVMQGRVDLKRLHGEVGMVSHGRTGESVVYDRLGVVSEVAELWRPYRVLV